MTIIKEIGFDDIREGDTIRVVDVQDVVVSRKHPGELLYRGGSYLKNTLREGSTRKFQLVERPMPEIPTKVGSLIKLESGGGTWILVDDLVDCRKVWIRPESGTRQGVISMQARVNSAGGFEVIL